jgi:molybdopterin molybdotransferase
MGIAKDSLFEILRKIKTGLQIADMMITTGGTSVGATDVVPEAVNKIGKPGVIIHGIAMRPGMPTALAMLEEKPIVILPGNPVAAMIGFEVFARPIIFKMLGLKLEQRPKIKAKLTKKVHTTLGRKTFVRVCVRQCKEGFFADPISSRGSGLISTMANANGYVVVSENREGLVEGEHVMVHLFDKVVNENV